MKSFITCFYHIPGIKDKVLITVPCTGNGRTDYARAMAEVRKLHPNVPEAQIHRIGSTLESFPDEEIVTSATPPGATLRQLFPTDGTGQATEVFRDAGTVFWQGNACNISLRYFSDKGTIGLVLSDRLSKVATRFSSQWNASLLAETLPALLQTELGQDARDFKFKVGLLPAAPEPVKPAAPTKQNLGPSKPVVTTTPPPSIPATPTTNPHIANK